MTNKPFIEKDELERDMAHRGFIDWQCPDWLLRLNLSYANTISVAMDIECGFSRDEAISFAEFNDAVDEILSKDDN